MSQNRAAERAASISFRQLKLFEAIGRLNSVRRASDECSLSQPAVTQALAKLEEEVGAALVERRASGSYLNDLGVSFHARTKRFFGQLEEAVIAIGAPSASVAKSMVHRLTRAQARVLVSAIENKSFDGAAAALGISVASLQRAARDLEGNLHHQFFHRSAAGVMVTPTGREFGRRLRLALKEIEWGIEEIEAARGGAGRRLTIGAMPFGGSVMLASVLDDFLRMHPQADVRIANDTAPQMTKSLRAGDVDLVIGLLAGDRDEELVSEALAETPYSVVVRRGHPLLARGAVTTDDLMTYDWVVGTPGSSRRACFDRLFIGRAGPVAPLVTCATSVIRQLLLRSDRLTLMTSYELMHENAQLRALPYAPIWPAPSIGVTTRAGWLPTRLHLDFMDVLRAHVAMPAYELRDAG